MNGLIQKLHSQPFLNHYLSSVAHSHFDFHEFVSEKNPAEFEFFFNFIINILNNLLLLLSSHHI